MAMLRRVTPETLDHVALWVADRDPIAAFVTERVKVEYVEHKPTFSLT